MCGGYVSVQARADLVEMWKATAVGPELPVSYNVAPSPHLAEARVTLQYADTSSVIRTLTLKLAQERARHRRELTDLRAALAAAHGELLLHKRQQGVEL